MNEYIGIYAWKWLKSSNKIGWMNVIGQLPLWKADEISLNEKHIFRFYSLNKQPLFGFDVFQTFYIFFLSIF